MEKPQKKVRLTREESKAQTRKTLLNSAAEVFSRFGFHGASIDMVAEAAGFTKGAVYAHFQNKEELYLALLDEHLSGNPPVWIDWIEAGTPVDSIAEDVEKMLPEVLEQTRPWAILTLEFILYALRDEEAKKHLNARIDRAEKEYIQSLEKRYTAQNSPPPFGLEQISAALMAFENGISIFGLLNSEMIKGGTYTFVLKRLLEK
jgi:AcrR family transcriptional regulator